MCVCVFAKTGFNEHRARWEKSRVSSEKIHADATPKWQAHPTETRFCLTHYKLATKRFSGRVFFFFFCSRKRYGPVPLFPHLREMMSHLLSHQWI